MVSARPGPSPAKGRIAYPRADAYVPGDEDTSPAVAGVEPTSESAAQSFAAHIRASSPDLSGSGAGGGAGAKVKRKGSLRSSSPDTGPKSVGGLMKGLGLPLTGSAVHASISPSRSPPPGGASYGLGTVHDEGAQGAASTLGTNTGFVVRNRSPSSPPAMQQTFPRHASSGSNAGISAGAASALTISPGLAEKPANTVLLGHSSIPEADEASLSAGPTSASAPGANLAKVKSIQIPVSALFANELGRQDSRGSEKKGKGGQGKNSGTAGYTSEGDRSPDKDKDRQAQGLKSWWKGFIEREKTGAVSPVGYASGVEGDKGKATRPRGASASASTTDPLSSPGAGAGAGTGAAAGQVGKGDGKKVFGVPLAESIEYASVQVSTVGEDGSLYVWGVIPVVVARCGLYLKETATEVEGAFRISGSAKRMRDLQEVFDTPPRYGKDIKWDEQSYTPHDVATIFRRFLTLAPESIIPTSLYEDRHQRHERTSYHGKAMPQKLIKQYRAVLADLSTPPTEAETTAAIARYKTLILSMPAVNQYLLLYVLDLLSVFARKSEINLMTTGNLAMIFQPGVLAHPVHAMRPREHVLSQKVLEFLIENQDEFLVGMELEKPKKRKSKRRVKADKEKERAKAAAQKAAQLTKADPDLMPPSESDSDAPTGGYYIIEGNPKVQASDNRKDGTEYRAPSIRVPTQTVYNDTTGKMGASTSSLARTASRASVASARVQSPVSAKSTQAAPAPVSDLPQITALQLAPPPPKPRNRSGSAGAGAGAGAGATAISPASATQPSAARSNSQIQTSPIHTTRSPPPTASSHLPTPTPTAIQEEMEPSDSDEDLPDGTKYEVHVSEAAKAREAKANVKAGHGTEGRRGSLGLGGGEGKGGILGLGLGRRRTVGRGDR